MAQTRTLITGGAGFIGSHLADALLARGDRVEVLDDLSTGRAVNLARHADNPALSIRVASVCDENTVDAMVAASDRVFHLAAGVGVRLLAEQPASMLDDNVRGTAAVLASCARHGKPVLVASSSEVYGKSRVLPQHEDADIVLGPPGESRWSYACSKAVGEYLSLAHHQVNGLAVVVARFFNTVGPRQRSRYGMVIPRFIRQAESGVPITVYGDGRQTRCFCHVKDTVAAAIALLETPAAVGRVVNVGSTERVTIRELANLVKRLSASRSEIVTIPFEDAYRPGFNDMRDRQPDLERLASLTGLRPARGLHEIVADTLADFRRANGTDVAG
jgi:UDP-glucose 4-epimerase